MKKIISLLDSYAIWKHTLAREKLERTKHLKKSIKGCQNFLQELRLCLRDFKFETAAEEIKFFKYLKPKMCGELMYFNEQLSYLVCKPNSTISFQRTFLMTKLKKLESKKRKNLQFYKYYKQKEVFLDEKYFLRGNEQLALFNSQILLCSDPEFFTSHDMKAAEVIAYDLLVDFYKKELLTLDAIDHELVHQKFRNSTQDKVSWSSSKTDLIELVYALKVSGAINGGTVQIKQLIEIFENLFQIDLGNYYKTYSEIKNRGKDRAKFLNKLAETLISRLEYDDSL